LLVFSKQTKHLPTKERRQARSDIYHFVSSSDFMGFERNPLKLYRELDNAVLLLDTIFYRKSPAFQGTQAGSKWHRHNTLSVRVISWDSKEIPWNRIENSTSPVLLLDTFCLFFQNKQNTRSDIYHFVSSSDFMGFERNPMKSYRELDKPKLLLDTIFYRKSLEVTLTKHLVSSSDFMGFERNPMKSYRELDLTHFTSRYNFLSKITRSDRDQSLCQFEWFQGIRKKSHEIVSRTRLTTHD
jgi:hypothetical protein